VAYLSSSEPQFSTSLVGSIIPSTGGAVVDPPLAIIDTTGPDHHHRQPSGISLGTVSNSAQPIPLVTGVTLTHLQNGLTQIEVDGIIQ